MVIVDTTVWIDYLAGIETPQALWLDRHLVAERLGLLDLILCEVLQGVENETQAVRVRREMQRFQIFETGGIDLAAAAARNYRILRSKDRTVRKTIDCLVATFCLREGHSLLHSDRDFNPFETQLGLAVIHPSA